MPFFDIEGLRAAGSCDGGVFEDRAGFFTIYFEAVGDGIEQSFAFLTESHFDCFEEEVGIFQ